MVLALAEVFLASVTVTDTFLSPLVSKGESQLATVPVPPRPVMEYELMLLPAPALALTVTSALVYPAT